MKKFYLSIAVLATVLLFSMCEEEKIDTPETPDSPVTSIDSSYIAPLSVIVTTWQGEYSGYDAVQKKDTKIGRTLKLSSNGTYTNVIEGRLDSIAIKDYISFEKEAGTYSYNALTGIVTYTVQYDSLIDYKTLRYTGYSKKHYYSGDGKNADDKKSYTEKAVFTTMVNESRSWVTKDTYLQQLSAEKLEVFFLMSSKKSNENNPASSK